MLFIWFITNRYWISDFPGGSVIKNMPASTRDIGSIPGSGRSPREGNGSTLQNSCLGNPMDGGVRRATVLGLQRVGHDLVTKQQHWFTTLNKLICTALRFYFYVPSRILDTKNLHPPAYSCSPYPFLGFCPLPSSTSLVTTTLFSLIYVMQITIYCMMTS